MAAAVPVLEPAGIQVSHLDQVAVPTAAALGRAGLAIVFVSFFAATFAAAAESALSSGYSGSMVVSVNAVAAITLARQTRWNRAAAPGGCRLPRWICCPLLFPWAAS
jgi:hypothetical protein